MLTKLNETSEKKKTFLNSILSNSKIIVPYTRHLEHINT